MGSNDSEQYDRRSRSVARRSYYHKRRHRRSTSSESATSTSRSERDRGRKTSHAKRKRRRARRQRHSSRASSGVPKPRKEMSLSAAHERGSKGSNPEGRQLLQAITQSRTREMLTPPVQQGYASAELPREQPTTNTEACQTAQPPAGMDSAASTSTPSVFLSINDISQIIQSVARQTKITYDKNIIPTFNPSQKNQRIEGWIAKVNECSKIYSWTDEQTAHYALPKLEGHARKWYEGLQSILLTWTEWQDRLMKAFPSESNYGALLSEMLDRRMKLGETVDEYYYDKMLLLNACGIAGKRAVDCLVYGIEDRTIRASASSIRCQDPEDLFKFLKDLCRESNGSRFVKRSASNSMSNDIKCFKCLKTGHRAVNCRSKGTNEVTCYNCKEPGHTVNKCSKPIIRCDNCQRIGHNTKDCYRSKDNSSQPNNSSKSDKKILFTQKSRSDSKYYKTALINNIISLKCYVDFGSDCTLIRQDIVSKYSLPIEQNDVPRIRGFGNGLSVPLGKTKFNLCIGEVTADIDAYVIESSLLTEPLLVGQDFTERPDVMVLKTHDRLDILKRTFSDELSTIQFDGHDNHKIVLKIRTDTVVVNQVDYIKCTDDNKSSCDVFIDSSVRRVDNANYCIIGGVYSINEGECQIAVSNISKEPIFFRKETLLSRGERVYTLNSATNDSNLICRQINSRSLTPFTMDDIKINPYLTLQQKQSVLNLINAYRQCFAQTLSELGCTGVTEMNIELNDTTPVVYRPYRLSHSEREKVREMVQELIDNDIVEESNSPYASPIILVKKKTGGYRLCVDFRALNRKTKKDHFPMPRIDDQLDMLNGNKYFTSLDLASGYYQIQLSNECKHLTAFITPDGLFQFKKMPFGLVNSPAVFQRTINQVLGNSRFNSALAYMDDILIPGKDFNEEFTRLENTFKLLQEAKLTLNIQKCNFFQEELEYLGYEIGKHGIRPGKEKICAVERFPAPCNVHEVRQFIGLASYFRKFIQNFASIARPLTNLTRKGGSWCWGIEQQTSFAKLKEALIQRPVLGIYDPKNETFLHTDASKYGLGGILLQKTHDTEITRPIAYYSRKTSLDEQNYHAYELETLAFVAALQRFRVYLLGIRFTLVTDCSALRATFGKRDLIPRIARWWIAVQEFDFDIQYKPGHTMSHVDALSRNSLPCGPDAGHETVLDVFRITPEDWLLTLQLQDTELLRIKRILEDNEYSDIKKTYVLKNNKLFRKVGDELKWVVPKMARFHLCKLNHDEIGHFSVDKTIDKISKDFWFPKMKRFIKKYVHSCLECAYSKEPAGPKEGLLHPIHKVDKPFDTVHIDHLGPFVKSAKGNAYLLVLVDGFTKFCILTTLKNVKSTPTISALDNIFCIFGYPNRLISDQGSSFTSREFKYYCDDAKINHILNAVASPRANGQVERYNRTVLDALTAYTDKLGEKYWDRSIGKLQWGLNNTINKGIGKTPAEALFAIPMVSKGDNIFSSILNETRQLGNVEEIRGQISEHIIKNQQAQKSRYDKTKIKAKQYEVGDLVKILKPTPNNDGNSKKLLPKFTGPFRITKVLENDRYEVSSIPGTNITQKSYCNVWAADRIKPWISICNDEPHDGDDVSGTSDSDTVIQ